MWLGYTSFTSYTMWRLVNALQTEIDNIILSHRRYLNTLPGGKRTVSTSKVGPTFLNSVNSVRGYGGLVTPMSVGGTYDQSCVACSTMWMQDPERMFHNKIADLMYCVHRKDGLTIWSDRHQWRAGSVFCGPSLILGVLWKFCRN